jgi:hypothetical protein
VVAAVFFAFAPQMIMQRFQSIFDAKDPTRLDRVAMLREGGRMIAAHPIVGVGPNMVEKRYEEFRGPTPSTRPIRTSTTTSCRSRPSADCPRSPCGSGSSSRSARISIRRFRSGPNVFLSAAALASLAALLTAGLFEYNFGDSEVLMLFLMLATLPAAARFAPRRHRLTACRAR